MLVTSPTGLKSLDLATYNHELDGNTPTEIIEWVAHHAEKPIITTNFRPQTSAILHLVTQVIPDIPVLWVDTGYNTDATLAFADTLIHLLKLNVSVYEAEPSDALDYFKKNGIPQLTEGGDNSAHDEFTKIVKLDPFTKALEQQEADTWITGIRKEQTEFRQSLNVLSYSKQDLLKVAPIFNWSKQQQLEYIDKHSLPDENRYFDPTKIYEHSECGIQLL